MYIRISYIMCTVYVLIYGHRHWDIGLLEIFNTQYTRQGDKKLSE